MCGGLSWGWPRGGGGRRGPLVYGCPEVRAWLSEEGLRSGPERLLVRRSLGQDPDLKYHRTNAPPAAGLVAAAGVRSRRWAIAPDTQNARGECGLDEYETR